MLKSRSIETRFQTSPQRVICHIRAQLTDGYWVEASYDEYRLEDAYANPLSQGQRRALAQTGATIVILDKIDDYIMYGPNVTRDEDEPACGVDCGCQDEEEEAVEDTAPEGGPVDRGTAAMEAWAEGKRWPEYCIICNGYCKEYSS